MGARDANSKDGPIRWAINHIVGINTCILGGRGSGIIDKQRNSFSGESWVVFRDTCLSMGIFPSMLCPWIRLWLFMSLNGKAPILLVRLWINTPQKAACCSCMVVNVGGAIHDNK